MVCHLRKSLYGLKQAFRACNTRLKQELQGMDCTASEADPGLFAAKYKGSNTSTFWNMFMNILVASKRLADIKHIKARLTFDVRGLGEFEAKYFLGMSLDTGREAKKLRMSQERLATKLVHKAWAERRQDEKCADEHTHQTCASWRRQCAEQRAVPLQRAGW